MEYFGISQKESEFHIEGFPDAAKVVQIDGPKAKRLSDLALHKADLDFADQCLDAINQTPKDSHVIREALWRSAIVHFLKCFGDSGARFQLSAQKILKTEPPQAMMAFSYFRDLRNKHLVHDENSYAQSLPGAILNKGNKDYKIEKIVCLAAIAVTLVQDNFSNLKMLIQKSRTWVVEQFDLLCKMITEELENEAYTNLCAKQTINYSVPVVDEIHKNRNDP